VYSYVNEKDRFSAGINATIVRMVAPVQSVRQEMGKSPLIRGSKSSNRGDLVIIKKHRLTTRFFAAFFRVVNAVQSGNVPRTFWYRYPLRPHYAK
jgi:hypothetical protein